MEKIIWIEEEGAIISQLPEVPRPGAPIPSFFNPSDGVLPLPSFEETMFKLSFPPVWLYLN
jgi:hypothetical protein